MNKMMNTTSNETISIFGDPSVGDQYMSFTAADHAEKVKVFNAINSPDARLADVINTPITVRDVIITKVKLAPRSGDQDSNSGFVDTQETVEDGFRVVVLDMDGKSYTATSRGIYNSMCNLRAVFGGLHFEDGLKMLIKQVKTKNGNTLTINLV